MLYLFDFLHKTSYTFNLDLWFSQFDNSAFFNKWYDILKNSAQHPINISNAKYFQYPLSLGEQSLLLHFNIDHILSFPYKKQNIKKIMLTSIGTPTEDCTYIFSPTPQDENKFIHLYTSKPIILCPFPSDSGFIYVIIDGNHRVTFKKKFHLKNINALYYIPGSANDFATQFEYNIYMFLHELFQKLINN